MKKALLCILLVAVMLFLAACQKSAGIYAEAL